MLCSKCGISETKRLLFDVVSRKGITKVCNKCCSKERSLIIQKPSLAQLNEAQKESTSYKRFSRAERSDPKTNELQRLKEQDNILKNLANKNYVKRTEKDTEPFPNLIDNFHWIIMRARRLKKLTREQFANEIAEPEEAIKLAEKGIIPKGNNKLVNKIEGFLRINILKQDIQKTFIPSREVDFKEKTTKILTISDLREMKKQREAKILGENEEKNYEISPEFVDGVREVGNFNLLNKDIVLEENFQENNKSDDSKRKFIAEKQKENLTDDDMNDLIFGRG